MRGERGNAWVLELLLLACGLACGLFGYGLPELAWDASWEPVPRTEGGLRIVTWNLGGSGATAGRPFDDEHLAEVAATLRRMDADLILVQEVSGREQLRRLANAVGSGAAVALDEGVGGRRVGAIAVRGGMQVLDPSRGNGGAPLSLLYISEQGREVHVVALHAHPWSASSRNGLIGRSVDLLESEGERYRVLCGDLNLDLDRGKRQDLFTDDEHLDIETYNYAARALLDAGLGGGPTAEPDRRLDYVFVSESFEVQSSAPYRGQRKGDMDHHPLVADLEYR